MRKYRTMMQVDTWDKISYRMYLETGGEYLTSELISANEEYAYYVIFPAGIILQVPEAEILINEKSSAVDRIKK